MVSYVVLWLAFVVKIARSDTVGNSLVTCTACQAVQAKDFACNVNCQVANGNNGKCSEKIFYDILYVVSRANVHSLNSRDDISLIKHQPYMTVSENI